MTLAVRRGGSRRGRAGAGWAVPWDAIRSTMRARCWGLTRLLYRARVAAARHGVLPARTGAGGSRNATARRTACRSGPLGLACETCIKVPPSTPLASRCSSAWGSCSEPAVPRPCHGRLRHPWHPRRHGSLRLTRPNRLRPRPHMVACPAPQRGQLDAYEGSSCGATSISSRAHERKRWRQIARKVEIALRDGGANLPSLRGKPRRSLRASSGRPSRARRNRAGRAEKNMLVPPRVRVASVSPVAGATSTGSAR